MTTNLALKAGRDIGYHTNRMGTGHAGGMAYYTGATGEPPGVWAGRGAEKLGLSGAVDPGVIHRLFHQDITPDGEVLTGKRKPSDTDVDVAVAAWMELHPFASGAEIAEYRASQRSKVSVQRPYFDFALGLVKSASVLHASLVVASKLASEAGDMAEARRLAKDADDIERAMMEVAALLVTEIETTAAYTRTGHHSGRSGDHGNTGEWRDTDGVIAALFLQHTSHEGDPHLHIHITVQNRVQRADHADPKYRTLDSRTLYRERLRLAAIADREMETRMTRLGWVMETRADGNGAEVAGVDPKITKMFSSRRASITPELDGMIAEYKERHGHLPNDRARWLMAEYVSMRKRAGSKGVKLAAGDLLDGWEARTAGEEVRALSSVHEPARAAVPRAIAVLDSALKARVARVAVAEVQSHHATWTMAQLMFEIHRALPVLPADADPKPLIEEIARVATGGRSGTDVVQVIAPDLADVTELGVRVSDGGSIFRPPHEDRFTTIGHLDLEEKIVADAKRPVRQLVSEADGFAAIMGSDLNAGQIEAVLMMLTAKDRDGQPGRPGRRGEDSRGRRVREGLDVADRAAGDRSYHLDQRGPGDGHRGRCGDVQHRRVRRARSKVRTNCAGRSRSMRVTSWCSMRQPRWKPPTGR